MIPKSCTFRAGSSKLLRSHVSGFPISSEWHKPSSSQKKYFGATLLTWRLHILLPPKCISFGSTLHFCCNTLAACLELAWLGLTLKKGNVNEMLKHIPMTQSETGGCGVTEGLTLHSNHMWNFYCHPKSKDQGQEMAVSEHDLKRTLERVIYALEPPQMCTQ